MNVEHSVGIALDKFKSSINICFGIALVADLNIKNKLKIISLQFNNMTFLAGLVGVPQDHQVGVPCQNSTSLSLLSSSYLSFEFFGEGGGTCKRHSNA